jgi:hypothetical protein
MLTVSAAGPENPDPLLASYLDNKAHEISPDSFAWYRFDYSGTDPATIRLVNGNRSGVEFEVWGPENLNNWWEKKPVGMGTAQTVNCDTGIVTGSGSCQSNDLFWSGAFGAPGAYYVRVINRNTSPMMPLIIIEGKGVSLLPRAVTAPALPAQAPALGAGNLNLNNPAAAAFIGNQPTRVPANSGAWFKFNYGPTDANSRPVMTIVLRNGHVNGLRFDVFTPSQMTTWWESTPIGRGTTSSVNCDTGILSAGAICSSNDLMWSGAFVESGTYYVHVINDTGNPVDASFVSSIQ